MQNETKEKNMGGGEAIMICLDTSTWMTGNNSHMFKEQADAVRLYCTKKFESHPETVVGLCGFSDGCLIHLTHPARNLSKIMRVIDDVYLGGYLLLLSGVSIAYDVWFCYRDKELGKHLPKRIVVFAGGRLYEVMDDIRILAQGLKEKNVACDAISFGDPERNKQKLFETLIALVDNNGNCNHVHVPPKSSICAALSRSKIFQSGSKQNINALSRSKITGSGSATYASILMQPDSSKQNINAVPRLIKRLDKQTAANYPESVDPHDYPAKINALSQSVVDLKLENVKSNSQPETLDERIEKLKQELESLLMQKSKQEIDMASFTGVTTLGEANNATQKSKQEMKKKKKKKKKNKQVAC